MHGAVENSKNLKTDNDKKTFGTYQITNVLH